MIMKFLKSRLGRLAILAAVLLVASMSVFTVYETEQAIVVAFGKYQRTVQQPGLHFKVPVYEQIIFLDKRILALDVRPQEIIASDQERLVVDAFARFKIVDPLRTYQRVQSVEGAKNQLATVLNSNVRNVLGSANFPTLLSPERVTLMQQIHENVSREAENYGIEIIDVRIKRADLPEENAKNVYNRMRSQREQEAQRIRSSGEAEAIRIRADAERQKTIMLANAQRDAQILRGEGDGQAVRIFAESFGQDEEFFEFYRSMQAYETALGNEDTTLVLSPDSEFFKFFGGPDAGN